MKNRNIKKILFSLSLFAFFVVAFSVNAQTTSVGGKPLSHVEISFSPRSGSFVEGSTFEVPILLNTKGKSINGIEIRVNFDKDKLAVVNPSGGISIVGIWLNPPQYDNTRGTASYVGIVPNGITTESGLVGMITFKAKATGRATVSISQNSKILLNDGLGTETALDLVRAEYDILVRAPEGVQIYSETHPFQENWYNNNNPTISWLKDLGVLGFSFSIDNKPNTVPDNIIDGEDTTKTFEELNDGLWYFHVKANKSGVWGTAGHFLVRIDTVPPAKFKPRINFLSAALIDTERTLVSFFTTDNLSGVDHYELGVIDKNQPLTESPVFIQAESPFQVPLNVGGKLQVIVRAVDKAGNVRDESIDVRSSFAVTKVLYDYPVQILLGLIFFGLILSLAHFLFGHHLLRYIRRVKELLKKEKIEEEKLQEKIESLED